MMTRTSPDDFDTILRDALSDVARATQPDPDLADLLLANVRSGRPTVTRLTPGRHARRWVMPLLAAASIVALAIGAVVVARVLADSRHTAPPAHHKSTPVTPPPLTAPVVPDFHAYDISFTDPQHGWAIGDAKCPSSRRTDCPTLLATSNGGTSWRALSVPKGLVSTFDEGSCGTNGGVRGPCVDSVVFANASDGYLWSLHDIYWTTDGGRHWSRYVGGPAHDWNGASRLVVVNGSVVRLTPIHQCSSGCAGSVQTARVGTAAWRTSTPTSQEVGLYSSNLAVVGSSVYLFAGETEANTSPGIFRSDNGGGSWVRVATDVCGAAKNVENDPFDGSGSTVAADGSLVVGCRAAPRNGIRVAAPGSTNFSALRRFPPRGNIIDIEAAESQQHIIVADTSNAYGPGNLQAVFYATSDGGQTWTRTTTIPVRGETIRFIGGGHGYAIAQGSTDVYATADSGATWQRVRFGG